MDHVYDVVIIGAGFAGIYTLKHCIEENMNAILLEKESRLGGVWNADNGAGCVQDFTYAVTSKLYMSPSDFPPPEEWPEFPHSSLILQHLIAYVDKFQLRSHIRMNQELTDLQKNHTTYVLHTTQKMVVRAHQQVHSFFLCGSDAKLVIATGVNKCPFIPPDPFYRTFSGTSLHVHNYTSDTKRMCESKRILIVGGSDNAADIANDVCRKAARTYVSIRDGVWFQDRMVGAESPADMYYSRLVNWCIKNVCGKHVVHRLFGEGDIDWMWGRGGSDIDIWHPKCEYLNWMVVGMICTYHPPHPTPTTTSPVIWSVWWDSVWLFRVVVWNTSKVQWLHVKDLSQNKRCHSRWTLYCLQPDIATEIVPLSPCKTFLVCRDGRKYFL
jgi:thioredoxin reductase